MPFATDSIQLVRDAIDDPESTGNYTDTQILGWLENSFAIIVPSIFANASGPNGVRWNLTTVADQESYTRPPHLLEIWGAHKVNTRGEIETWLRPRSPQNPYGPGILLEGNRISFIPKPTLGTTYRIWYVPGGECRLAEGPLKTGSTTSAVKLDTPTKGTLDPRDMAYGGYLISITAQNGVVEERMVNTSSFDGTDHICTVAPDFTVTIDTNATYEVRPLIGKLVQTAVVLDTALMLLAFREESKKSSMIERRQRVVMRQLRLNAANEEQIVGGHFAGDTLDNERYIDSFPLV